MVTAKKKFGQHFLKDKNIAFKVAELVPDSFDGTVIEVGPGMGVLTEFLLKKHDKKLIPVEIDLESVEYLIQKYPQLKGILIQEDFLKWDLKMNVESNCFVVGNFPYNISSQILFKILENREVVSGFGGMFQREVARRIVSGPGNKEYGILSVLAQAFYKIDYCFTVNEDVFSPPPKVKTGVIKGIRYRTELTGISVEFFFKVVKTAFNQRRKTLRNSLSSINNSEIVLEQLGFTKLRAENLSVDDFINLAELLNEKRQ
jgi:16S rRNA (adenine1518-N6/adenine1519-N6)-dimethyltransferase